jgi:hypothetical protein
MKLRGAFANARRRHYSPDIRRKAMRQLIAGRIAHRVFMTCVLCLVFAAGPASASTVKSRLQAQRLLMQVLPCAGTLAANVDQAAAGGSYSRYSLTLVPRLLARRDAKPADIEHAAELVMGMVAMDVNVIGSVDAFDPAGPYEAAFNDAVSLQQKDRKAPAALARVKECVAMAQRLAPAFEAPHAAAIEFGLIADGTPLAAPLIDASESDRRSASGRAKDDARRNADAFVSGGGYVIRCRVAEDDDLYTTKPRPPGTTTPAALDREQMQALAAGGQTVFTPCTYAGTERSRYQAIVGQGAAAFIPVQPAAPLRFKVHGLANANVQECSTSTAKSPEIGGVVWKTTTTSCSEKGLQDFDEYTELKGTGEGVVLASQDEPSRPAAMHQRMRCALYVRDMESVASQLPGFLAAVGDWRSLQDYSAQRPLWQADNYAKASQNYAVLNQRAGAKELLGKGRETKIWARKIADELFFPSAHLGEKKPPDIAVSVPDSATSLLADVLRTGPSIWHEQPDPRVQSPACLERKQSFSEKSWRFLASEKEEKQVADKVWGSHQRGGEYGPGSDRSIFCYRFDDTVDPLACAPYYPQLWARAERLPPAKELAIDGEDIY